MNEEGILQILEEQSETIETFNKSFKVIKQLLHLQSERIDALEKLINKL